MAKNVEVNVKVKVDDASVKKLDNTIKDLENNPVEIPVNVTTEGSIAQLRELKKELKNAAAGSEEFNKLFAQIDDLEEKIKGSKKATTDWVDTLASAPGPLGALGKGINAVKEGTVSFGGALKATGIGLVVAALGLLVGAFKDNDTAMKKIQPLLDGLQKVFQGVFRAVEPLFNMLVDLALKALPFVTDAIGTVTAVVISFVKSLGSIASAIGKLLSGDFSGAWDSAKEAVSSFGTNFTKTKDAFNAGTQEMTKNQKEEAEKQAKILEEQEAKRKEAAEKEEARKQKLIDLERRYTEEIQDLQATTDAERLAASKQHEIDAINLLDASAKEKAKLIALVNKKYKELEKDAAEERAKDLLTFLEGFKEKEKAFKEAKNAEEIEAIRLHNEELIRLEEEEQLRKATALGASEEQLKLIRDFYKVQKDENDASAAEQTKTNNDLALKDAEDKANKEIEYREKVLNSSQAVLDGIVSLTGQETALGKAALLAKQGLAVAELALNIKSLISHASTTATKATVTGAGAAVDIAAGAGKTVGAAPFPANIPLIIGYAAQALAIAIGIKSALTKVKGASAPNVTTPTVPSAPAAETTVTTALRPQINLFGQPNQLNNVATPQTVQGTTQEITVKAVVSESDMTNTQGKIKQIQQNAELGG